MINICTIRVIAASLSELEDKKHNLEKQQQKLENKKDEITEQKYNMLNEIIFLYVDSFFMDSICSGVRFSVHPAPRSIPYNTWNK